MATNACNTDTVAFRHPQRSLPCLWTEFGKKDPTKTVKSVFFAVIILFNHIESFVRNPF